MEPFAKSFQVLSTLGQADALDAGRILWRQGDSGDEVVLLLDGILDVVHEPSGGEPVILRSLERGAIVGELACLDGRERSAGVRAVTACRILRIPAAAFQDLVTKRHDILLELFWQQIDRVRSLTGRVTQAHRASITDSLTGLYNFGFFRDRVQLEAQRARATGDPLSLAVFDIDHFKDYNDRFGHAAGNAALVKVATTLCAGVRRGDIVARYGGEEFVALFYGATLHEAETLAEKMRRQVHETRFGDDDRPLHVTVSGGVANLPDDADGATQLFETADARLFRAKETGRDRIVSGQPAGSTGP
jgi:diguanylate cyclase (GGDEF)-like protein